MPTELEMKLAIPNTQTAERIFEDPMVSENISGDIKTTPMSSVYYDTPGNALSTLRWSLRIRYENGNPIVSLKTPSVDVTGYMFSRNEWQVCCADIDKALPMLVDRGAPGQILEIIGQAPLVERCHIEFVRKSAILRMHDGVVVDMAIDNGTINADDKSQPILQLELELLFGSPEALAPLSTLFTQKYKLEREVLSKYEKALRLIRSRNQ